MRTTLLIALVLCTGAIAGAQSTSQDSSTTTTDANWEQAVAAQILLDRVGFSPGEIDGKWGKNGEAAATAYAEARGLDAYDKEAIGKALTQETSIQPLVTYTLTEQDVSGPFVEKIPTDLEQQGKLDRLGYTNKFEALGEKFHSKPELLQKLNPEAQFVAGEQIRVPNVEPLVLPQSKSGSEDSKEQAPDEKSGNDHVKSAEKPASDTTTTAPVGVTVTVSKSKSTLTVTEDGGAVIFHAPVTSGSERDPLPIGEWKVNITERNPSFKYNPDLFWDADPSDKGAKIAAGPNNPVGLAWVDITKEHYGLHGTPEPGKIGYSESHGCVRLTNWDVLRLADMVKPGTKVLFVE